MRTSTFASLGLSLLMSGFGCGQRPAPGQLAWAENQTRLLVQNVQAQRLHDSTLVSPRTTEGGRLKMVPSKDWTSGFFPGLLWYYFNITGDTAWRNLAEQYTSLLEVEKTNGGTHDMGFKINSSFGNGYRLTGNPHYREVMIEAARTLCTRYSPAAGVIRSWDHHRQQWQYPVIIDNMMNLELLFEATRLSGDSSFYRIAVSHADRTLENHFRSDYSSYHVVDYDTLTGKVIARVTHQGYADSSAWARGQAWGLYGFTMCYRYTHDQRYRQQAEHIAAFLQNNPRMPEDGIPFWDFDAPQGPGLERDASAAAVIASGLLELSGYSRDSARYRQWAGRLIDTLSEHYEAPAGTHFGFLLLHSTGNKPSNSEVDVPLIYADYYFLEALLRRRMIIDRL